MRQMPFYLLFSLKFMYYRLMVGERRTISELDEQIYKHQNRNIFKFGLLLKQLFNNLLIMLSTDFT